MNLIARKGYVIRRIGADPHSDITGITVKIADVDNYEEVLKADVPAYTKAEYDTKVAQMVRERYSESEEFALQRKMLNSLLSPATLSADTAEKTLTEYSEYNNYVERCKADAPQAILDDKARNEAEEAKMREEMEG